VAVGKVIASLSLGEVADSIMDEGVSKWECKTQA